MNSLVFITLFAMLAVSFAFTGVASKSRFATHLLAKPKHKVTLQFEGKETIMEVREDETILNAAELYDVGVTVAIEVGRGNSG